jgi:TatD DNase family protein
LEGAIERGCYFSINGAMMRSKRFVGLLPLIPSDRILLETDSPFIDFNYSHTKTLQSISSVIKEYMPDVDIWSNFRRILE